MKYAVYTATRNLYDKLVPSIKSLLINSDVDKIYLLIEDDKFPVELPREVECINVSNQRYFRATGSNNVYPWAYMCMMRAALCKVLDIDMVLSLDADTIIDGDISGLWELPMEDYYFAAVPEPDKCQNGQIYTNIGVALFNLEKMRDGKADEVIKALNWNRYYFLEQDALNEKCQGSILALPSAYNVSDFTAPSKSHKIIHYAGIREWMDMDAVKKYADIPWDEIRKPKRRKSRLANDDVDAVL